MTKKLRKEELAEALGRVLDRMDGKSESLDDAIEAVYSDYGGLDFASELRAYAQGRTTKEGK